MASGDIQVIARCAQLLRLFSSSQQSLRVSEVASEVRLQRTTVHRYLASMANADLLERDDDGGYRLGPLLVQLGTVALRGLRVLEISQVPCQALADEAHETAVISVWGGLGPVVARVHEPAGRLVNINVRVGSPLPLDAAQSLVYMAFSRDAPRTTRLLSGLPEAHHRAIVREMDAVREAGYAINSHVVQGIRTIAAPVLDGHGQVCATVAVVGTVTSLSEDPRSGVVLATLNTAHRLSLDLGWRGQVPYEALLPGAKSAS